MEDGFKLEEILKYYNLESEFTESEIEEIKRLKDYNKILENEKFKKVLKYEFIYSIQKLNKIEDVVELWNKFYKHNKDFKLIISLEDDKDTLGVTKGFEKFINDNDGHLIPYFANANIYFLDNEIVKNNENNILFDYSFMMDTNYASYISRFVNNNLQGFENQVYELIDCMIRKNVNFDYIFYLIENLKQIDSENNKIKKAIFKNIADFERFKSIDTNKYITKNIIEYSLTENQSYQVADEIYAKIFTYDEKQYDYILNIQRNMLLCVIGILQIKFSTKKALKFKISEFVKYMYSNLGIFLQCEFYLACKYYENQNNIRMLNKIGHNTSKENLRKKLDNFAWDFSTPIFIEFFTTNIFTSNEKSDFFVPYFVTADKDLKQLWNLYPRKALLYNTSKTDFHRIGKISLEKFLHSILCENDANDILSEIQDSFAKVDISERNKMHLSKEDKIKTIDKEFEKLCEIMKITD